MRVTPRGGRDVLLPGTDAHLVARLSAAPVDGAANAALLALVSRHFGIAKRDVTLVGGRTARLKRVRIAGDPQTLAQVAASLYASVP